MGVIVMAYVITAPCKDERAGECVEVCPVDCIEPGEDQYYINPDICIDCGACQAACPVEAIFYEEDLLEEEKIYLEKAKKFYNLA